MKIEKEKKNQSERERLKSNREEKEVIEGCF